MLLSLAESRWLNCGFSWGRWDTSLLGYFWTTCYWYKRVFGSG